MKKQILTLLVASVIANAHAAGHLRRALGADPKSIDPQLASESSGSAILYDTFEGLITRDAEGKLVPGVSTSWEVSDDGLVYTFKLRESKWSNGEPLTAHDFVYAWRRAVNPATGSIYAFVLYPVLNAEAISSGEEKNLESLGIEAVDDYTLKVTLASPAPYLIDLLTHYTTYPAPRKAIEAHGDKWTQPENYVTNGPYVLKEWLPNSHIVAEKSPHYFDKDAVSIDKVTYFLSDDDSSSVARYRAGEIDISGVTDEGVLWAKKEAPNELIKGPALYTGMYLINLKKKPLGENVSLRKALSMAVDRDILTTQVLTDGQFPAYGMVPPATDNAKPYQPEWASWDKAKREAEARRLYQEAGYSDKNPLEVSFLYNTNEGNKKIAVGIAAMWEQVLGVKTTLENKEWKVMLQDAEKGNFEILRYAWLGDYNDPNTFLEMFKSNSSINQISYNSNTFDELLDTAAQTQDLEKRAEFLNQAEQTLVEDYAALPLFHSVSLRLMKPYVKGYVPSISGQSRTRHLRIEK